MGEIISPLRSDNILMTLVKSGSVGKTGRVSKI